MPPVEEAVERAVRSFAAAMIGEIAHELNNRLATMRETVGLLDDLARAGRAGTAGTARAHASLDDQVGRGLNIVRSLGELGLALGASTATFDAGAAVGELLGLSERWARRHSLRLERDIADDLPAAAGHPAVFLCLAHRRLLRCGAAQPDGGGVLVRVSRAEGGMAVRLAATGTNRQGASAAAAEDEEIDRELATRLGGTLILESDGVATIWLAAAQQRDRR
jgi:hypothetical protein